jgi:hypothetical protein
MSKDRIQIDGVWYVKEEPTKNKIEIEIEALVHSEALSYEITHYAWEASRIYKSDDKTFYEGVDIHFTDKRSDTREGWIEDYWDNNNWIVGVYENNPDSLVEARMAMCEEGIAHFQAFVGKLKERGWL